MELSIDQVNFKAKSLLKQGDIEYQNKNYQEALKLFHKAYDYRMLIYTRVDNKNSGIYRRLALSLLRISDDSGRNSFPSLSEANIYVKLYIKIKNAQIKALKDEDALYFILGNYNLGRVYQINSIF